MDVSINTAYNVDVSINTAYNVDVSINTACNVDMSIYSVDMSIFEYQSLLIQKNLFFLLKMTDNLVLGIAGCVDFGIVRDLWLDK